ncbi:hypothetical protein C8R45DRAFT_838996 [Mycena sanguinolenta]|nr:hypothetical protein C8R45DRAFT_838996 [Mycena sanguinolenta]
MASAPATPPTKRTGSQPSSSGPVPFSTPYTKSAHTQSDQDSSTPVSQEELKHELGEEIANRVWQFEAKRFAQMVSRKKRKSSDEVQRYKTSKGITDDIDRLEYYDIACNQEWFEGALNACCARVSKEYKNLFPSTTNEHDHYAPLARFLELCFSSARHSNSDSLSGSVYDNLHFLVYDKPTGDGVAGAAALKPALVALQGPANRISDNLTTVNQEVRVFWSPPKDEPTIAIPVEVKKGWVELLRQAATYALCLFNACPLRNSALVLGYNHVQHNLRFLLFHRGGVSSSFSLDPGRIEDRRNILRVVMALLTCRYQRDLGIPEWCNEKQVRLPVDKQPDTKLIDANIDAVLYSDICCRGRATRVYRILFHFDLSLSAPDQPLPSPSNRPLTPMATVRRSPRDTTVKSTLDASKGPGPKSRSKVQTRATSRIGRFHSLEYGYILIHIHIHRACHPLGQIKFDTNSFELSRDLYQGVNSSASEGTPAVLKTTWMRDDVGGVENSGRLEQEVLKRCSQLFGCSRHHYSFQPLSEDGVHATNHLFLPNPSEKFTDFHWSEFGSCPPAPEYLSLFLHLCSLIGSSLAESEDPVSLFRSVLHGMLGWLAMFQAGFLHRDVSIGNLLRLATAEEMTAALDRLSLNDPTSASEPPFDYKAQAKRVERWQRELGVGSNALGFMIDGDCAVRWHKFADPRNASRSGTYEFISRNLRLAKENPSKKYLHSPVDDLHSFYFVAQWAATFHTSDGDRDRPWLQQLRHQLAGIGRDRATFEIRALQLESDQEEYGDFLPKCGGFLSDWDGKLSKLERDYKGAYAAVANDDVGRLRSLFMTFAYRGVADYMELFAQLEGNPGNS